MKRKYLYSSLLIAVVLGGIIVWMLQEREQLPPIVTTEEEWKVTMNLLVPENGSGACGVVTITLPENSEASPIDKLRDTLGGNIGEGCQYWPDHHLLENIREDKVVHYSYEFGAVSENWLEPDIPTIRQDIPLRRFCFYTYHEPLPVMDRTWWDRLGCDVLTLTLILPENYDLVEDIAEPLGFAANSYKDNEYSIFTTATELSKEFEDNRWRIEASWTLGEFDKFNTPLYLEIHYLKTG